MLFVVPHKQLVVAERRSTCCSGRYGWKKASLPNKSNGKPMKLSILRRSDVFNSLGFFSVSARAASAGLPQSSNVCKSSGIKDTKEYWYVQSRSTGWPKKTIYEDI